jgi:O-antigen/teichoic acid export membrane protein
MPVDKGFEKDIELEYRREDESLGQRAVVSGAWVFAFKAVQRLLGLIRTVILARLLAPEDFGLMGIAVLAINTLETFSKTGFEQALIQKKEDIRSYLDPAWTVQVIRSLILFCLLFAGAPLVALFFKNQQATYIIRMLAFIELFTGLKNIGIVYFQKELRFDKRFILESFGLAANITVSIVLAFVLRNVWALVYGSLAGAFVTCIVSYAIHRYRPRFRFNREKMSELFGFGKWLFGSSILVFLVTQGDSAFVGRLLGITALGFYQMAYHLSNMTATEVSHVVLQVMFPVYSKMQQDIERLGKAYLEVLQLVAFISAPIAVMIFMLAKDFTAIFLGEKWLPMVPAMKILAFAGFFRSIAATAGGVFFAVKKPRIETGWEAVRLLVLVVMIYPASKMLGITGTSVAVCVSIGVLLIGFLYHIEKTISLNIFMLARTLFYPVFSAAMLGFVLWGSLTFAPVENIASFTAVALFNAGFYLLVNFVFEKLTNYNIYGNIRERVRGR